MLRAWVSSVSAVHILNLCAFLNYISTERSEELNELFHTSNKKNCLRGDHIAPEIMNF